MIACHWRHFESRYRIGSPGAFPCWVPPHWSRCSTGAGCIDAAAPNSTSTTNPVHLRFCKSPPISCCSHFSPEYTFVSFSLRYARLRSFNDNSGWITDISSSSSIPPDFRCSAAFGGFTLTHRTHLCHNRSPSHLLVCRVAMLEQH